MPSVNQSSTIDQTKISKLDIIIDYYCRQFSNQINIKNVRYNFKSDSFKICLNLRRNSDIFLMKNTKRLISKAIKKQHPEIETLKTSIGFHLDKILTPETIIDLSVTYTLQDTFFLHLPHHFISSRGKTYFEN